MPHVLVSGIAELVAATGAVLTENGATFVGVDDIADVPKACAEAERRFDGYVQLPATFTVEGDTAVSRVHHFFAEGVLARFPAVAAALGALQPGARITFVMGVLPPAVSTEDDVRARSALVRVLGHAARADGPADLRVSMLASTATPTEIALTALGRNPQFEELAEDVAGGSYADWRVELLGVMTAHM